MDTAEDPDSGDSDMESTSDTSTSDSASINDELPADIDGILPLEEALEANSEIQAQLPLDKRQKRTRGSVEHVFGVSKGA